MARTSALLTAALLTSAAAFAADEAPGWLRDAAASTLPAYGPKVPAVVLFKEESVAVNEAGTQVTTSRYALKALSKEGARYAEGRAYYNTDSSKVRAFNAWMIYPSGKVKKFGKEGIFDVAVAENDIYNETRFRTVDAERDCDPGAVFGYEAVVEEKSVFTQSEFSFQYLLPVLTSRFTLTLPTGWSAESKVFNHPDLPARSSAGTYTWELSNLPHVEVEDWSPNGRSLSPRLAVTFFPSSSSSKPFASWESVSQWLATLNDSQAEPDDAIRAKALELTSGLKTEMEKIRALGRFAQDITYVSIQTGVGRGGGYKPHLASQVFQKRYGDCKDKANLMRSMLKALGITAYPVAIFSGDRNFVHPDWPSPQQFNHAISAISVSASVQEDAVGVHPKLGRLLYFDPTDSNTPAGSLPDHEQDSYALVVDANAGGLVKIPAAKPNPETWVRKVEASLLPTGGIEGTVSEHRKGGASSRARRRYRVLTPDAYQKLVEILVSDGVPGAKVNNLQTRDSHDTIQWSAGFASERFAQVPQAQMMIFRAGVMRPRDVIRLTEKTRKLPVVMDSDALVETAVVKLPEGFQVDELPEAVLLESKFGRVEANWKSENGAIHFTRRMALNAATVPAAEYPALKKFLDAVSGAAEAPVVLMRR